MQRNWLLGKLTYTDLKEQNASCAQCTPSIHINLLMDLSSEIALSNLFNSCYPQHERCFRILWHFWCSLHEPGRALYGHWCWMGSYWQICGHISQLVGSQGKHNTPLWMCISAKTWNPSLTSLRKPVRCVIRMRLNSKTARQPPK